MNSPKISIIVPIFNVEKYLDQCVQSLLQQTLHQIEIILVDDESPDNSPRMCDEYAKQDHRIKVIHKKNGGLGFARNSGLEIATGEYVSFVDADDFVDTNMYESLYSLAKEYGVDEVRCGHKRYFSNGLTIPRKDVSSTTVFKSNEDVREFALDMIGPLPNNIRDVKYTISAWGAIHRRDVLIKNNLFFQSEREILSEDLVWDAAVMPMMNGVVLTPSCYYYYRENENSLTHSWSMEKYNRQHAMFREIENILKSFYDEKEYDTHLLRAKFLYLRNSIGSFCELHDRKAIETVINDSLWHDLLYSYPYKMMDRKKRFYFIMLKTKCTSIIYYVQSLLNKILKEKDKKSIMSKLLKPGGA